MRLLIFFQEKLFDMFSLATQWFETAHTKHPNFIYPNISWNCRSRAGASQHHGHAHMVLAEEFHYGHWERLKQISQLYTTEYPGKNYFHDLVEAHRNLNLAQQCGDAWILIHIVPYCGYEFMVICWDFNDDFKLAVYKAVHALVNVFDSNCFNICIQFPPLENGKQRPPLGTCAKRRKLDVESKMPYIAHIVDRGDINKGTSSDVCSMRIYGSAIVNEDPFILAQSLDWI
jgi:galactose-1-phosphate uridylyltransferase